MAERRKPTSVSKHKLRWQIRSGRCVKVTTQLHLVLTLRMRGALHPFAHTFLWRGY